MLKLHVACRFFFSLTAQGTAKEGLRERWVYCAASLSLYTQFVQVLLTVSRDLASKSAGCLIPDVCTAGCAGAGHSCLRTVVSDVAFMLLVSVPAGRASSHICWQGCAICNTMYMCTKNIISKMTRNTTTQSGATGHTCTYHKTSGRYVPLVRIVVEIRAADIAVKLEP